MNRSKDLDNIAPDDPILTDQKPKLTVFDHNSTPPTKKSSLKTESVDDDNSFRQNVYNLLGHSKSSFSNFLVNPKILTFAEKETDETIYLAVRPHLVSNISWMAMSILMLIIPLFLRYFSFIDFLPTAYRLSVIFFWYLITFIFTFENFLSWYFDFYIITNKRIIDISFNNLLNKHFAQTEICKVQDVSSSVKGLLPTFFNFGDLLIQTASEINQINFEKVPNPSKIIKLIKELQESERTTQQGGSHD